MSHRTLEWPGCLNVRDLGGLATTTRGATRFGRVIRADNLLRLEPDGRDEMIRYGIRTVVDLRDARELQRFGSPDTASTAYLNVALISDAEWDALRDPEHWRRGYLVTLELSSANIARVFAAIAGADAGGVVVHCNAGKERTGIVTALLLKLADVGNMDIADDYVESERHLEPLYEEWLAHVPAAERPERRRSFTTLAEHILPTLEHLDAHGGVEAFLLNAGLDARNIRRLRRRLID